MDILGLFAITALAVVFLIILVSNFFQNKGKRPVPMEQRENEYISYTTDIAGVKFHNDFSDVGCFIGYIAPERENAYDPNAIAIYRSNGKLAGYIPKIDQESFRGWARRSVLNCVCTIEAGTTVMWGKVMVVDSDEAEEQLAIYEFIKQAVASKGRRFIPDSMHMAGRTEEEYISLLDKKLQNARS